MKYRLLKFSLLSIMLMLLGGTSYAGGDFKDFAVIVNNQEGTLLTADEQVQGTAVSFGVAVADDGTVSRVAADDASAVATISGKYHSEHGLANFSATVKVDGPVKVSMGTCAWGGDVTIKNADGEVVGTFNTNTGACYHQNKAENIASTLYKGGATTLTISGGAYTPYFSVEALPAAKGTAYVVDLTDGNLLTADEIANKTSVKIGLSMVDGVATRIDAEGADAVLTGKYHSNEHGWSNFSSTVKVEGPVKISMGTCAWGGDVTIKNGAGETVGTFNTNTGACYHQNKAENIVFAYYKGDATSLTISGGAYTPYFAVEPVSIADIPSDIKVTFALGDTEAVGVLPAEAKAEIGSDYTLPLNRMLYAEGKTLTGWTDGTNTYKPGETIKAGDKDMNLVAVFTDNKVALADRTEPVDLNFDFQRKNGAPLLSYQGGDAIGVYVTQAVVNGETIDVKLDFDATSGKIANGNWNDWAQMNGGTKFTIPSCKGATVSLEAYSPITTTTIDGQTDYAQGETISYVVANTAATIDIIIGDGSYYRYIKVNLPVAEKPFEAKSFDNEKANIVWNLNSVDEYATPNTLAPEGGFTLTTVNVGDFSITVDAPTAGANNGVKMLKLQPSGDNTTVEFIAKPYRGLTFTPTKVSAKVARFGTDGGTLSVSAKNAEGKEVSLASGLIPARNNRDQADDAHGSEAAYTAEFSFEIPAELATAESFSLVVTESGLANNKQWGIGDVHIEGSINGTTENVPQYTITAKTNNEKAGSVNVYPQGDKFDEGTELKLTATENFGYDFVNWTDAQGTVLSEEPVFVYTLEADAELTANFKEVNTYELAYGVEGGANLYQVQLTPAPTVRDGKNMYEQGTEVTMTASSNAILTFNNWSNGETSSEIKVSMDKDYNLTANYSAIDYIAGWDFYLPGNNGRVADFYSTSENDNAQLILIDNDGNIQGWLDKCAQTQGGYEGFAGAAVNWKKLGQYHYQTKVNAKDFTNIKVKSQLLYNYNAYTHVTLDWSTDGENWQTAGEVTMAGAKTINDLDTQLPAAADHAEALYIRWMPDLTGAVDGANAPDNDGTSISNIYILADAAIYDDGTAPVLVSTVPAEGATNASANGRIVLNFDEKVALTETADIKATLNGEPLALAVSGKTITAEYKGLQYSTDYTFVLKGGSVSDLAGNVMKEEFTLNFKTMSKPTVQKGTFDFIVPDDGSFKDALAAAAARSDKSKRYRIFVKQGDYIIPANESNKVTGNDGKSYPDPKTSFGTPNVSIIGEGMSNTSIANQMPGDLTENPEAGKGGVANPLEGIRTSGLLYLTSGATNTYFQDITLKTNTPDGTGRNVILVDGGNHTICKDVCLWAYQDTYVSDNTRSHYYFEGGLLRGRTDFLCGSGDVFYNQVTLQMCESGGYIAVPRDNVKYGYVFKDCTIKGEQDNVNGNYYLGRPWTKGAEVYYIDTKMEAIPTAVGWHDMSSDGCTRMCEWNSMSASGNPIDLSSRTQVLGGNPNNPWMTQEEAEEIGNMSNMFGDWDPRQYTEQAPVPTCLKLEGSTLSWDNSDYVLCWAVCKDGKVVAFTTEPSYTVSETGNWSVRAANEMGGLSEAATLTDDTGINTLHSSPLTSHQAIYNLKGQRVQKAGKGLYIVNGKKVIK